SEPRPFPPPGSHNNGASKLGNDAGHERQAEAGAFTDTLGGEEGIEHPLQHCRRDAGARVADDEPHIRPGGESTPRKRALLATLDALEKHAEYTTALHCMECVGAQVHRHLMQMRGVSDHCSVTGCECFLEATPRRQRGCEQLKRFLDHRLNVHRHALTEPAAAEAENALDERLCTPRRVHDIVEVAPQGAACSRMLVRKLAVPQDRAEDVVEVMGDTAGQCPDRLHLLRLPQLRLQVFLVDLRLLSRGDVNCRADEPIRLARRITQATATCEHPTPLAFRLTDAVFALVMRRTSVKMIA